MEEEVSSERRPQELQRIGNGHLPDHPSLHPIVPDKIVYTHTRLVTLSPARLRERRVIAAVEEGPLTEAYKILRTQVMLRMRENEWNLLGITGPGPGAGSTLTAANLAVSLAREVRQTVLLVDAHLRHPAVHQLFGIAESPGLVDHLLDHKPVEDLLVHPGLPRLVLLPAGRAVRSSSELLTSPPMLTLISELKNRYASRIVLFDLPPLLPTDDVLALSPYLDAMLLVIEAGRTQTEEIIQSLHLLKGVPVVGTVLNKG
jgi:capsular exopolysaccharide synthesis family protein